MFEFIYTVPQLDKICGSLETNEDDGLVSDALDRVQFAVQQALGAINEVRQKSVDSEVYSKYLKLGPSIAKILKVLEHEDSQVTLLEHLPELVQQLNMLKQMVEVDQRRRGGQTSTEHRHERWLITELARIFNEVSGTKPTAKARERFDPSDEGGDPPAHTAFEQFLHACVEPTDLELSDHLIREGIKASLKRRDGGRRPKA